MAKNKAKMNKFLTGAITATMVASAVAPTAALADDKESTSKFTDISGYAQETQDKINALVDAKIINGTSETTFSPTLDIKRGQVVKLLGRYLVESGIAEVPANWDTKERFKDVPVDFQDADLVKNAAVVFDAGVFQGNNGSLDAAGDITRQNMALVLDRAAEAITGTSLVELSEGMSSNVSDLETAKAEAREAIKALNALGLSTVQEFKPAHNVTRANFATFLYNAIEVIEKITVEAGIESVKAINKTTVEVKLNQKVDSVKAEYFTIEGASVSSATLAEDKKTVTLTVSGLEYGKEYTVVTKDIEVDGDKVDFGSKKFSTPAVADLWTLAVETKDATLKADGADNTEVTFKLLNANGEVDLNADNMVLDLNTTFGTFAQKRVTIQDGQATVLLTSEFSNTNVTAKIDAQIIEASGDYKELIGKVVGTKDITFVTSDIENVNTVTLVSAEANQADRATLFFDKDVSIKHFVKTNTKGELLFTVGYNSNPTSAQLFTAEEIKANNVPAEDVFHALKTDAVKINQAVSANNGNFQVKGIKPVSGNTKAMEVVLDKSTYLTDNANVEVTVNTENSLGKVTKSEVDFKVTDARVPSATGVTVEGLTTLKVKYSEPIANSTLKIDGRHEGVQVANVSAVQAVIDSPGANTFVYYFGDFNPATQEDQRDLATLTLTKNYKEDFQGAIGGYFGAGNHTVQASSTKDFAYETDKNNIGTTQNLNFTIAADKTKPAASVSVESPEQFRLKFDKSTDLEDAITGTYSGANKIEDLFTSGDAKVQVYDKESKEYVDVTASDKLLKHGDLQFKKVSASEFVVELTKDWTEIYKTGTTGKNYYNDKYRIVIAKDKVTNVANGLQNDLITLDLNYSGSPLNAADVTSPVIDNIKRVATFNRFNVEMSEPVKLQGHVNGNETLAEEQASLPTTTAQFMGVDKDGNKVTFNGTVNGYADTTTTRADKVLSVSWNPQYYALVDGAGKAGSKAGDVLTAAEALNNPADLWDVKANVATLTPQDIVDQGGNAEWDIVVRAISDDVGNTAASATAKFNIEKSAATETPFFITTVAGTDGAQDDKVEVTFSEGVQWTGTSDATNPAQYTLNGETLPEGTSIAVQDVDGNTANGYEKVIITLPNNTLNNGANESNVITVNKNLVSYDGSVIERATEHTFTVDRASRVIEATSYGQLLVAIENAQAGDTVKLLADINGSVTVDKPINIDLGGKNLTGNLKFDHTATGQSTLSNGTLTGNLEIDTVAASFTVDGATVTGTTTVTNVAPGTFTNKGILGAVTIKDADGTRFVNDGTIGAVTIDVNNASATVLLEGAFGDVTVSSPATITSAGTVAKLIANAAVTFDGEAPETIEGSGEVTDGEGNKLTPSAEEVAKEALTNFLTTAKDFEYSQENGTPEVGNYKNLKTLTIDGLNVTIDISKDAEEIAAIQGKEGVAEDTAPGLYVMNTFARYLGALNYVDNGGTVSAIKYGEETYTWKTKNGQSDGGYLKGSNWRQEDLTTLVSVITSDVTNLQETDTLTITLVDAAGHSVDVVFNVKTQE